jgi:uncharacterized caspase-like protein
MTRSTSAVAILSATALAAVVSTQPSGQAPRQTAYVIAVGINDYAEQSLRLRWAAQDAEKFAARIVQERCDEACMQESQARTRLRIPNARLDDKNPSLTEVVVTLLRDRGATLEAVDAAFAEVVKRASPDDVVIFFFSGHSLVDHGRNGATTVSLCTADGPCNPTSPESGITGARLRHWLESTRASRQLIVLDACSHPDYSSELISAVSVTDGVEAGLSTRNRVVVSSLSLSFELQELGGLLTHVVAGTDAVLTRDPFEPRGGRRHDFERRLRVREADAAEGGRRLEIGLFFERDFLDLWRRAEGRLSPGIYRGLEVPSPKPSPVYDGVSHALVIGTDRYSAEPAWGRLANPVLDARAIAKELETRYGFAVTLLENPRKREINTALRRLQTRTYGPHDQVFVFFAGHGHYDERMSMGFLVPADARPLDDDEDLETYISYAQIEGYINNIPAQQILVALDACFGGTFSAPIGSGGARGDDAAYRTADRRELIGRKLQYKARLYVASGGREYVPDGRPGRHSPFASRFLEALRGRGVEDGVLTMAGLRAVLERIAPPAPQPRAGSFGDDEPGSDFLFVAR